MNDTHISSRGMTLLEVVVWIAVFTSAMLALSSTILMFYRVSGYSLAQSSATTSAQKGIDLLVRTLREASYSANGAYPVVAIASNDIRFYTDIDNDATPEQVHYYLSGGSLMKGVIEPTGDPAVYTSAEAVSSISDYVHNIDQNTALFTYYDKNGAQITDMSEIGDVRFVKVNLLVDVDTSRSPFPLSLRSSAALRNLIGR